MKGISPWRIDGILHDHEPGILKVPYVIHAAMIAPIHFPLISNFSSSYI
jgi:hypothetical protein